MRDSNVPKFLEQDIPLFGGILMDLFPGIKVPYVDYGKLQLAIEKTLDNFNLQRVPTFITKIIQVKQMFKFPCQRVVMYYTSRSFMSF
jgi:dynein heavy chain